MIWLGRKVSARRCSIGTSCPVFGLRPMRRFLSRKMKLPNEEILTLAPFTSASEIWSRTFSTSWEDSARDRPIALWTASPSSARVSVACVDKAASSKIYEQEPHNSLIRKAKPNLLPAKGGRAPRKASTHRLQQQQVALFDPAVAHGDVERARHRGDRGVRVLIAGDDDLLPAQPAPPRGP